MRVTEFFGRVRYFLKVWVSVMAFLVFCYFGVLVANGFMDWIITFTFTEEQIVVGILVLAATSAAVVMTWLNWLRIV